MNIVSWNKCNCIESDLVLPHEIGHVMVGTCEVGGIQAFVQQSGVLMCCLMVYLCC